MIETIKEGGRSESLRERGLEQIRFLEEKGVNPYPAEIPLRSHKNQEVTEGFGELGDRQVQVVGRMTGLREHGKMSFFDLTDETGRLQAMIDVDGVGEEVYEIFRRGFGLGDFVGVSGEVFKTRTGEVTVNVKDLKMLAKALLPPPTKWVGLKDVETRSRQRYLDLMLNEETRERFRFRSRVVQFMRNHFLALGCLEVETPILDTIYGGASAKPFTAYHQALGTEVFLRISNELYLKRLLIGGLAEGVFEFSTDFRNEGMDRIHNPEFTQVELYKAYTDYQWMMEMAENLMADVAQELLGKKKIEYQGQEIDLSTPWRRLSVYDGIRQTLGFDPESLSDQEAREIASKERIDESDRGYILLELFDKYVQPTIINPTFVIDFPASTSPLTKPHREKAGLVERFECVVAGMETMNCYTELNDPRVQRANFEEETRRRLKGDEKAMPMDEDFILAMEYGMPPMGGIGISIDRWTMVLKGVGHIREVILFPTMKPKN